MTTLYVTPDQYQRLLDRADHRTATLEEVADDLARHPDKRIVLSEKLTRDLVGRFASITHVIIGTPQP